MDSDVDITIIRMITDCYVIISATCTGYNEFVTIYIKSRETRGEAHNVYKACVGTTEGF